MRSVGGILSLTTRKVARNWHWGRTHGWRDLIEEHDANPLVRVPRDARKLVHRLRSPIASGQATVVLLVGAQRSGTNMIVHGLEQAPQFAVYNEGNHRAFTDYQLRSVGRVQALVQRSRLPFVLLKPLCDSHRLPELLADLSTQRPARGVWAYRGVDARVRSYLVKFGDRNLVVLREFVSGRAPGHWMVQGMSPQTAEWLCSLDVATMSPASGAALFWYVRNVQFFEQGLDRRADVALARYEAFLAHPEPAMRALCDFLGFAYRPALIAHIQARPVVHRAPLELHPAVRARCEELQQRLDAEYAAQLLSRPQVDPAA